jgi:methylmalonyl-CoA mutase N-terminal domain/subunit
MDTGDEDPLPILRIDPGIEAKQIGRVQAVRARRDGARVEAALAGLREAAARERANLMEPLLDAARAHATEGEIVDALQDVFGTYTETPVF